MRLKTVYSDQEPELSVCLCVRFEIKRNRNLMWRSCISSVEVEYYKFSCSVVADDTSATTGNLNVLFYCSPSLKYQGNVVSYKADSLELSRCCHNCNLVLQ